MVQTLMTLTSLVALCFVSTCALGADNFLANGGFEETFSQTGLPAGWQAYGGSAPDTSLSPVDVARSGKQALLISDHNPTQEVGVSQTVNVPAEARYFVASVYVRAAAEGKGVGGFIQLRFLPSNKLLQTALRGPADGWQQCRVAGVAPEGTTTITLYLYTHRETICDTLVDDAEVIAVESPEELLAQSDAVDLSAFPPPPVTKLKDLHLETSIVDKGHAVASIVVPSSGRYDALAKEITQAVAEATGVNLPIRHDEDVPLPLPENTIILGNRSTNSLISRLYDQYYTYLDLKYPGPGGYDVRSLHNPFGNGRNAILVGASDDEGMAAATARFISLIRNAAKQNSLVLGWVMDIKLGEGLQPPEDADQVAAWEESLMYRGATYFGWNSISRRLALYYMTGNTKYLDEFMWLAFPDEKAKEFMWKVDGERIEDKDHPLSGPYHYTAHHMILLWDLVEESPYFTDEQRLKITQAFAEQLRHWQAEWCYAGRYYGNPDVLIGSRHDQWAAVCLYVLSRYFQKYYPHPVWQKNLEAVQQYFAPIGRTFHVAGELDHLWWYTTSYEPLVTYMVLSGDRRGIESGNFDVLMRGYDLLVQGKRDGPYVRQWSLTMAHKCAYLTGDGKYLYYRDLTSLDTNIFRIGQSFWPTIEPRPPVEIVRQALARPLSREEARAALPTIPWEQTFQFASYRTGLTDRDDYLLLDGFYGGSRNPYHCLALTHLRHGDKVLLDGYLNQVVVRQGGLTEASVPIGAALTRRGAVGNAAYFDAEVPNFFFGKWRRVILHVAQKWTLVADTFEPRQDLDNLDIAVQWELPSRPTITQDGWFSYKVGDTDAGIIPSVRIPAVVEGQVATYHLRLDAKKGDAISVASLIALNPTQRGLSCLRCEDNSAAVVFEREKPTLVRWNDPFVVMNSTEMYYAASLGSSHNQGLIASDGAVECWWDFAAGEIEVAAPGEVKVGLSLAAGAELKVDGKPAEVQRNGEGRVWVRLSEGRHHLTGAKARPEALNEAVEQVSAAARQATSFVSAAREAMDAQGTETIVTEVPEATATVVAELGEEVRWLLGYPEGHAASLCAVTAKRAVPISASGTVGTAMEPGADITAAAYWPEARLLLLGGKDDKVYAYDQSGALKWTFQSVMHPEVYNTGKTYWFKEALPGISGLLTGNLTGEGTHAIVGSACTIEVVDAEGHLVQRVPQYWGSVWRMAIITVPDGGRKLLAAKMPNGVNDIGIIDGRTWAVNYGFTSLPPGHTFVAGWSTMNTQHIIPADLDGDGTQEVVMDVNGTWNRLCVYNADGTPRWALSFGPSLKYPHRYMRGVAVADLDADGKQEIVVATKDCILACFDAAGGRRWTARTPSVPQCLTTMATAQGSIVAVGCEDGAILLVDATGKLVRRAKAEGGVTALLPITHGGVTSLWAATSKGIVARLSL